MGRDVEERRGNLPAIGGKMMARTPRRMSLVQHIVVLEVKNFRLRLILFWVRDSGTRLIEGPCRC